MIGTASMPCDDVNLRFFGFGLLPFSDGGSSDSGSSAITVQGSGGKSNITLIDPRGTSRARDKVRSHDLWTSGAKKRSSSGHRENDGTAKRRRMFERRDGTEVFGLLGRPCLFFFVA